MKTVNWDVKHQYQPTNNTCGYTALSILLSHYDDTKSPQELVSEVPQPKDSEGTSHGSVTAQLADWCQTQGYQVHMYVSDLYILDLSWKNKSSKEINKRLKEVQSKRTVPIMDKHWVKVYEDAYLSMLEHGSDITITPFITTELVNKLLKNGPVFANICSSALRGRGRDIASKKDGLRKTKIDDVEGTVNTHSVVIYGKNAEGDYLIADPWDGLIEVNPEIMVLAIEAAQIECDNQIFQIKLA